jgi:hypothetical protein
VKLDSEVATTRALSVCRLFGHTPKLTGRFKRIGTKVTQCASDMPRLLHPLHIITHLGIWSFLLLAQLDSQWPSWNVDSGHLPSDRREQKDASRISGGLLVMRDWFRVTEVTVKRHDYWNEGQAP